jgi:hypothetical protein
MGRAIRLTHEAGHAFHGAVFMGGQTVASSPPGCDLWFLFWVMPDEQFGIIKEVSYEMAKGDGHSLKDFYEIDSLVKVFPFTSITLTFALMPALLLNSVQRQPHL